MDWTERIEQMKFKENHSWTECAKEVQKYFPELDISEAKEKARGHIRKCDQYKNKKEPKLEKSSVEYKSDGSVVSEKFITARDGEEMTPEFLLEAHGLNSESWEMVSYKNNMWSAVNGEINYQSKLTARPRTEKITLADIDRYMNKKQFKYPKPPTNPLNYDPKGEFLEINVPDLHSGLLAWRMETGADYDINIATERFLACMYDIKKRCENQGFKKIIFATLGDLLHFDNENQTTTKGTFQQADGRFAKIYEATSNMIIEGITMLGNLAPVEVEYIKGNHDGVTGYALMKGVQNRFYGDNNIKFDTSPNPHKYQRNGNVLTAWTHGNMPKTNMASWVQDFARVDFGQSKFVEVHAGHFHTEKEREKKPLDYLVTDDVGGIVIRYLPTISNASYWEHEQGYPIGTKTMRSFIWNEQTGLRTMWYSNI